MQKWQQLVTQAFELAARKRKQHVQRYRHDPLKMMRHAAFAVIIFGQQKIFLIASTDVVGRFIQIVSDAVLNTIFLTVNLSNAHSAEQTGVPQVSID